MPTPLRISFARLCRDTRVMLDVTQAGLAASVGVSRAHIASIETGRANPSLDLVHRIGSALGLELQLVSRTPAVLNSPAQRDLVHAWCSGYVERRLSAAGWDCQREVTILRGRTRGWIDLLAYDPRRRLLLVVEVKTSIDDMGDIERQLDWYLREAPTLARSLSWHPVMTVGWVLALATTSVDEVLRRNRPVVARGFPGRARDMRLIAMGADVESAPRGIALIDPRSRRKAWLLSSAIDGRRTSAPYRDAAEARSVLSA